MSGLRLAVAKPSFSTDTAVDVEVYLPTGYKIIGQTFEGHYLIAGRDNAGWTLDGYVIPRLGSAMIHCEEIEA